MFKKEIEFVNVDGVTEKETLHFNYTQAEMFELDAIYGDYVNHLRKVMERGDNREIMVTFRELISGAYGEKTASHRFVKNKEISESFLVSEQWSELLKQLMSGETTLADFMKALLPNVQAPAKLTVDLPPLASELPEFKTVPPRELKLEDDPSVFPKKPERTVTITPMSDDKTISVQNPLGLKTSAKDYTREELLAMPQDQLLALLNRQ